MANFEQISEARKLLGLGETATTKQIKAAYRRAAHRYHPDRCPETEQAMCIEMMKRVNDAYQIIVDYCSNYSYPFSEEDVKRTYPHDEYLRRFQHGWFDGI